MAGFNALSGKLREDSPTPMIPFLKDIKEVDSINTILKIRNFVFSTVPWFVTPSPGLKKGIEGVLDLYNLFNEKKAGGWCGLNADYLQMVLYCYQVRTRPYNFGISPKNISHVGVIVEYDGEEFFMDPYLCVHYVHKDGFLLTFHHLMSLIAEQKFDRIVPVFSDVKKPVQQQDGSFLLQTPQEIQKSILDSWPNYKEVMNGIFGNTNPLSLMLIGIPYIKTTRK